MTRLRTLALGLFGLFLAASLLQARGRSGGAAAPVPATVAMPIYYVYPAPAMYHVPPPNVPLCLPEPRPPLAQPKAAPPSLPVGVRQEPPLAKPLAKGPVINHYRSIGGVSQDSGPRLELCKVSFWNVSGADVQLTVGDRVQIVARDRALILNLERGFAWKTNAHALKTEAIPDDLNHFEVLIK